MGKVQPRSEFLAGFLGRTVAARKIKFNSQAEICIALGWTEEDQATYGKYETRTPLPHNLISQFCAICGVSVDWLITARGKGPVWQPVFASGKTRKKPKKIVRAA
jgi:hypothetical protein